MDFAKFSEVVEKVSSDIFLYILIFIMEKRPFSKKSLQEFEFAGRKHSNSVTANNLKVNNLLNPNKLIASPNLSSKFSPSVTIGKSPTMNKRSSEVLSSTESSSILSKYTKNPNESSKLTMIKYAGGGGKAEEESKDSTENSQFKQPVKKNRINLKNIEDIPTNKKVANNTNSVLVVESDK